MLVKLVDNNSVLALYVLNIPFILAYAKKRYTSGILISIFLVFYYSIYFDINIIIFIFEYLIYYIIYFIFFAKKIDKKIPLLITLVIKCIMINLIVIYSAKLNLINDLSVM